MEEGKKNNKFIIAAVAAVRQRLFTPTSYLHERANTKVADVAPPYDHHGQ